MVDNHESPATKCVLVGEKKSGFAGSRAVCMLWGILLTALSLPGCLGRRLKIVNILSLAAVLNGFIVFSPKPSSTLVLWALITQPPGYRIFCTCEHPILESQPCHLDVSGRDVRTKITPFSFFTWVVQIIFLPVGVLIVGWDFFFFINKADRHNKLLNYLYLLMVCLNCV